MLAILDTLKAKGRVQEARYVLISARPFFAHAIAGQWIEHNPATDIPMKMFGTAGSRDRALDVDEIGKLLTAFDRVDFLYPSHPIAMRLLLLTLCRKRELLAAKRAHVDLDRGEWYVPLSNHKSANPHMVPLSSQAVELFSDLRKLAGHSPYALPSMEGRRDKPTSDTSLNCAPWQLTRKRNGKPAPLNIPHFTLHDFRRTGSTLLHANGYVSDVIEKALRHTIRGARGIYNKASYAPEHRTMLQFWAKYLDGIRQGTVVALHSKKGKRQA